jgi:hypothetical protein
LALAGSGNIPSGWLKVKFGNATSNQTGLSVCPLVLGLKKAEAKTMSKHTNAEAKKFSVFAIQFYH